MNRYGRQIHDHWQRYLPRRYRRLPSPLTFFTSQGVLAAEMIDDQYNQLLQQFPIPKDAGFILSHQLREQAMRQASETVMHDFLRIDEETQSQLDGSGAYRAD